MPGERRTPVRTAALVVTFLGVFAALYLLFVQIPANQDRIDACENTGGRPVLGEQGMLERCARGDDGYGP
jgi:hypothetical protein